MECPVVIPHGDEYLIADLTAGGLNAVLILPGWGGTRFGPQLILVQAAHALAAEGYTTLRLDFCGRGDSSGSASGATLDSMIDDAVTAVNWLYREHGIQRINLVGLCSGGNIALGVASLLPDAIDHIVCWSLLPFMEHKHASAHQGRDRKALLRQMLLKALRPETWRKLLHGEANVRGAVQVLAKDKEGDAGEQRRKTSARNILADLETFTGKLHLIYGSEDSEAKGSQEFYEAWCKEQGIWVDTRVIPGAPHNFFTACWTTEVIDQTAKWLSSEVI